jgi:hypothetical protein
MIHIRSRRRSRQLPCARAFFLALGLVLGAMFAPLAFACQVPIGDTGAQLINDINVCLAQGGISTPPGGTNGQFQINNNGSFGGVTLGNTLPTHNFANAISSLGVLTGAQPSCADLSNAAPSCSVDATNASNITSGTLSGSLLPNLTGDTTSSGSVTTTLGLHFGAANAVTLPSSAPTSGGIPYFSSASSLASSGLLTANAPVLGGGAGLPPVSGAVSGNTTKFATVNGSLTATHCLDADANGNVADAGAPCGVSTTNNGLINHGGVTQVGSMLIGAIGTPAAPTVTGTSGGTNATYYCGALDINGLNNLTGGLGNSLPSSGTSFAGALTPNTTVTCGPQAGALGYVVLKNAVSGSAVLLGHCTTSGSGAACSVVDTGQTLTAYTANAADQTGVADLGAITAPSLTLNGPIFADGPVTTLAGTTAGDLYWSEPFQGAAYKKTVLNFQGYENTTATAQIVTYPTPYAYTPTSSGQCPAGMTIAASSVTLPASMSAPVSEQCFIEGQ